MTFKTVEFLLSADVAASGTVTLPYPSGGTQADSDPSGSHLATIAGASLASDDSDFSLTFNSTTITFTNGASNFTLPSGRILRVQVEEYTVDEEGLDQTFENLDLGASGQAGTLDIFPSTASKGKVRYSAADSAGDTLTEIKNASQAGARTYTVPDAGASADFLMSKGAQATTGIQTMEAIAGGDASFGITGQAAAQGGALLFTGGASSTAGNAGGAVDFVGGTPGATSAGGAAGITGGIGGATSGLGGAAATTGGAGTLGDSAGGEGSTVGGAGQGSAAGGAADTTGGVGGATGAGGAAGLVGGQGGATSGVGGAASVTGGAGTANNDDGGAVTIAGGAPHGTGATGELNVGGVPSAELQSADPSQKVTLFDDFLTTTLDNAIWADGEGSDAESVGPVVTAAVLGGAITAVSGDANSATTTVDTAGTSGADLNWTTANGGLVMEARIQVDDITDCSFFVGFSDKLVSDGGTEMPIDASGSGDVIDFTADDAAGIIFDTEFATSGAFINLGSVAGQSVTTVVPSATSPTNDTDVTLRVEINAARTLEGFINGVSIGTIASALADVALTPTVVVRGRTTATRAIQIDYIWAQQNR